MAVDVLKGMDPDVRDENSKKFITYIKDILGWSDIQTDIDSSLVECLTKIEEHIFYLCDTRNHLMWKEKNIVKPKGGHVDKNAPSITLEKFESNLQKEKQDEKLREFKKAQKQATEDLKKKQIAKANKSSSLVKTVGKKEMLRSTKKAFKAVVKKKDNMSQQTKDEKEYLGEDLFYILQGVR